MEQLQDATVCPPLIREIEGGDKFYVRDCYSEYYQNILHNFANRLKYMTVSGTPGIGKSVFYVYFFRRYRREHPDTTLVTAAFSKSCTLSKCSVYSPGKDEGVSSDKIPCLGGNVLYLYDGAPGVQAPDHNRFVCFTCPDESWLAEMEKSGLHTRIYMPLWSLEELRRANVLLEAGIDDAELTRRFRFFGGCVRFCLHYNSRFVENAESSIRFKIGKTEDFAGLIRYLKGDFRSGPDFSHHVVHLIPESKLVHPFADSARPVIASIEIMNLLDDAAGSEMTDDKTRIVRALGSISDARPFLGLAFENHCAALLGEYVGSATASLLGAPPLPINIRSGEFMRVPRNRESIDGYVHETGGEVERLIMFQITLAPTHPVNATGLLDQIERLDLQSRLHQVHLALVFVVPERNGLTGQQIVNLPPFGNMGETSVRSMKGIGSIKEDDLRKRGIETVSQLEIEMAKNSGLKRGYSQILETFKKRTTSMQTLREVARIPQYVLRVDGWSCT